MVKTNHRLLLLMIFHFIIYCEKQPLGPDSSDHSTILQDSSEYLLQNICNKQPIEISIEEKLDRLQDSAQSLLKNIQDSIFTPDCAICHYSQWAPHKLQLTPDSTGTNLINRPSYKIPSLNLVVPGNPDSSYLIWKIENRPGIEGAPMPNFSFAISDKDLALIINWIMVLGELEKLSLKPVNTITPKI